MYLMTFEKKKNKLCMFNEKRFVILCIFFFKFIELKEPITDLDKMTLEHLKLDNARILLETEVLKKESQKITI